MPIAFCVVHLYRLREKKMPVPYQAYKIDPKLTVFTVRGLNISV